MKNNKKGLISTHFGPLPFIEAYRLYHFKMHLSSLDKPKTTNRSKRYRPFTGFRRSLVEEAKI